MIYILIAITSIALIAISRLFFKKPKPITYYFPDGSHIDPTSRLFFKKPKPITYYFPDGSHIDPTFNDKFKYLIQHSKGGLYFDNYLICIEHNIMTVYEHIDGDYCMIPEIDRSMVIIHRYLF